MRLLFYTNDWEDTKKFIQHYNVLKANGYEVAFATDSIDLAKRLSVGRMLVVKIGTYVADIYVSTTKLKDYPQALPLKKFLEVITNE